MNELLREARAHNGIPNEGDYIRSNMVGYSYSITNGMDADHFGPSPSATVRRL